MVIQISNLLSKNYINIDLKKKSYSKFTSNICK